MNIYRNHIDGISDKEVERIFSENAFDHNLAIHHLSYSRTGYGHYQLKLLISDLNNYCDDLILTVTTTNSMLIDDWGEDEQYFQDENSGHWYDSNQEVLSTAIDSIISNEANQEEFRNWIEK